MHCSTETKHHSHIIAVDGVGLTETTPDVVEALCRTGTWTETGTVAADTSFNRHPVWRELGRLEDAGVVRSREADVDVAGSARKPIQWCLTQRAVDAGVVERLRAGSDATLDPVEERDERIAELEAQVAELQNELKNEVRQLQSRLDDVETEPDSWSGLEVE